MEKKMSAPPVGECPRYVVHNWYSAFGAHDCMRCNARIESNKRSVAIRATTAPDWRKFAFKTGSYILATGARLTYRKGNGYRVEGSANDVHPYDPT